MPHCTTFNSFARTVRITRHYVCTTGLRALQQLAHELGPRGKARSRRHVPAVRTAAAHDNVADVRAEASIDAVPLPASCVEPVGAPLIDSVEVCICACAYMCAQTPFLVCTPTSTVMPEPAHCFRMNDVHQQAHEYVP